MSERDIGFYVEDMLEFAQHALEYARVLTEATPVAQPSSFF